MIQSTIQDALAVRLQTALQTLQENGIEHLEHTSDRRESSLYEDRQPSQIGGTNHEK